MEKRVRISSIDKQDALRREDMLRLTPAQRVQALLEMRDQMYPYRPLERVVSIRKLG